MHRKERARPVLVAGLFLASWALFAEVAAPRLIEWLYTSDAVSGIETIARERAEKPLSAFVEPWLAGSRWALVAFLGMALVRLAVRSDTFRRRHVGRATPGTLGAIRAWVCAILLASVLWEDLVSTAALPRALADPAGVLQGLFALPLGLGGLLERLSASAPALAVFQALTAALLVLGALGWRTRVTLPLAAASYLVFGGLMREYAWFYHTGLVPWYVLAVLCFTPAGDGLSLDRRRLERAGRPVPPAGAPTATYGWARYAVWVTIALPYVEAGLSKLRRSGLEWFHPANLQGYMLKDTLNPMEFDFRAALGLVGLPAAVAVALAVAALGTEIAYGLVLVSRRARRALPAMMVGVHLGILLLQNVLFFDLILLQAVFYDWRPLAHRLRLLRPRDARHIEEPPPGPGWGPRRVVWLVTFLLVVWGARIEFYPLTAMQMYSKAETTGVIEWFRVTAVDGAGNAGPAPIAETIGAMADARYRKIVYASFEPRGRPAAEALLDAVARRRARNRPAAERIRRFDVELRRWDFQRHPHDPDHGERVAAWSLVPERPTASAPAATSNAPSGRSP